MSGATDSGMVKTMGFVLTALIIFAILCAVAARVLSPSDEDPNDPMIRNALIERIKPIGNVRTSADDLPAASQAAVATASTAPMSGEELVNGACASCHQAGVAEAPLLGDEAAWAERREAGLEALVASVINGKGSMPARGGSTYTDDEITKAVQHIALFEVDEEPAAAEESSDTVAEESDAGAASEESESSSESEESTDTASETEETSQTESDDASSAEQVDVVNKALPSTPLAIATGQSPAGLTDKIKTQVDGVCAGCHLSGVANAPKLGDVEAWQPRADKGLDALTQSVINGLKVMPPRGGSTLTDDEMPIAVEYLMSKQ